MQWAVFDVETQGIEQAYALQPCRAKQGKAWLTVATWGFDRPQSDPWLATKRHPTTNELRHFLQTAAKRGWYVCGWNTAFDVAWLIALGLREEVYAVKWIDGMLLWQHTKLMPTFERTKDVSFGLKHAVREFLPWAANYEDNITFNPTTEEEWNDLETYNGQDCLHTLALSKLFWSKLTAEQKRVALVEAQCIPMVAETLVDGIVANRAKAEALYAKLEGDRMHAFVQLKLSAPEISEELLRSPVQLRDLLHNKWGLPKVKLTEKGEASTDREALSYLAAHDSRASLMNDFREATMNGEKFANATLAALDYNGDGRVRPAHRIYGTYTGRMTISSTQGRGKDEVQTGVALHQWKRDAIFRDLIEPPEGYTLCEFDFAGQEFRWMGVVSGDPTMIQLCQPGEDAHSYMASQIVGVDYATFTSALKGGCASTKKQRQLGKVANLSLQYRTSADKLVRVAAIQHKIVVTPDEGKLIHGTYQRTYRRVPEYWKKRKWWVKNYNYVENPMGRRVWFRDHGMRDADHRWGYDSTSVNFPVQGAGADQKYLALMVLRGLLPRWNARFYFELHDGLFVIVPDEHVAEAVPVIKHALSNLPYDKAYHLNLPVQFPVDAKTGKSWGTLKEWQ